jgi:cephalosporin hydroxylase
MRVTLDTEKQQVRVEDEAGLKDLPLYSPEAFSVLSQLWLKTGWALKYSYGFTWLGRPIIQLPEDLVRIQEALFRVQPDVLVETGIAHGGSLLFYASLFEAMGKGRVVGVDLEIRLHNRSAIEAHPLHDRITLIEGSSVDETIVDAVRAGIAPGERVLVVLDSNHTRDHVARELEAYSPLVTPGSYVVVTDGIMGDLSDVPGGNPEWREDNPRSAALEFLRANTDFRLEEPQFLFNEGRIREHITYWPSAYLKRKG